MAVFGCLWTLLGVTWAPQVANSSVGQPLFRDMGAKRVCQGCPGTKKDTPMNPHGTKIDPKTYKKELNHRLCDHSYQESKQISTETFSSLLAEITLSRHSGSAAAGIWIIYLILVS